MTPLRRRRPGIDSGPRPLAAGLDEAMSALAPRKPGGSARPAPIPSPASAWAALFGEWEQIMGASLARHVTPQRLDGDVLVVAVDRPPWATQVRALGPQILAKVAEITGATPGKLEVLVRPK
jgi:hypothetical protein